MTQSVLPEELHRVAIRDMVMGEEGYTVAHAIHADEGGRMWIRGDYGFLPQAFGTSNVPIKRAGFAVIVDRTALGPDYEPGPLSYGVDWIPVQLK